MTVYNYAETFQNALQQKYERELTSHDLFQSNQQVKFLNAQTIKIPSITVSGYRDHNRQTIGFNAGTITNSWEPKKLEHDRDIEFAIDPMDVDETNLTVEIANVQNTLETEQVKYKFGSIHCEVDSKNKISYSSGSTNGNKMELVNPWMTQTILDRVYHGLRGLNFYPYDLSWRGDMSLIFNNRWVFYNSQSFGFKFTELILIFLF